MSGGEKFDNPAYNADLQNGHSSKGGANGTDVVIENGDKFPKSSKVSPSESGSDGGDEKKEKEEEQKTVGVGELVSLLPPESTVNVVSPASEVYGICLQFRYATCGDVMLMIIGSLSACGFGAALPLLLVVFGDMVDDFVSFDTSISQSSSNMTTEAPFDLIGEIRDLSLLYVCKTQNKLQT